MKKTIDVKATKLMVNDQIKVGDNLYRIANLKLDFGRKRKGSNRVTIHLHRRENKTFTYLTMTTPASTTFTIFKQK